MTIKGFLRSLNTISRSKTRNSKFRIQHGGHFLANSTFFIELHRNEYKGVFEDADYDFEIKNDKLKMADSI